MNMNNTSNRERLFWFATTLFLALYISMRESRIQSLDMLNETNMASERIQSNQIIDLAQQLRSSEKDGYTRGFNDGRTHGMIASIHGKPMYDYADGYHAALSQFYSNEAPDEIKMQITEYINSIMDKGER
jgi:23S rRNA maturation mini-RNase III